MSLHDCGYGARAFAGDVLAREIQFHQGTATLAKERRARQHGYHICVFHWRLAVTSPDHKVSEFLDLMTVTRQLG